MKVVAKVVFNKLPQITERLRPGASAIVRKTAFDISSDITEQMQGPKGGRLYMRSGGKSHQASAPGEAPAIDYGHLVNSIQVEITGPLTAIVGSNAEYAPYLEFGTSRMAARPAWIPAAERAWEPFQSAFKELIDE
jgi:phage gpG-like protein